MMPRREEAVEQKRLERALALKWDRIGPREYMVQGKDEPYYIVALDNDVPCLCRDVRYRSTLCKHTLRCLIVERHPAVFEHVLRHYERTVAAERERAEATVARRTRRRTAPACPYCHGSRIMPISFVADADVDGDTDCPACSPNGGEHPCACDRRIPACLCECGKPAAERSARFRRWLRRSRRRTRVGATV